MTIYQDSISDEIRRKIERATDPEMRDMWMDFLVGHAIDKERGRIEDEVRKVISHKDDCHWVIYCGDNCTCGLVEVFHAIWGWNEK